MHKDDDPDDISLFRKAMSGINQPNRNYQNQRIDTAYKRNSPRKNTIQRKSLSISCSNLGAIDQTTDEGSVLFVRSGLQRKITRQLKRGDFPIQSVLDLHGLRTFEAESSLNEFLSEAISENAGSVLIVHGKGYHSENQIGVLKQFTIDWLKQISEVKAFCSAQPKDGGTGAVYVLLKTN